MVGITTLKNIRNIEAQPDSANALKRRVPLSPDKLEEKTGLGKIIKDNFMKTALTLAAAIASGTNSFGRKGLIFASLALSACIAFGACGEKNEKEDDPGADTDTGPHSSTDSDTDVDTDCEDIEHNWDWANEVIGDEAVSLEQLLVDDSGASIIRGRISSGEKATFAQGQTLEANGEDIYFLVKYDASGNFVWLNTDVSDLFLDVWDMVLSGDGSLVVTGPFSGNITLGGTTFESNGSADMFVAKVGLDGEVLWGTTGGGSEFDTGWQVATLLDGSIFVAGEFEGYQATFGAGELNQTHLASIEGSEAFLARYNSDGSLAWAVQSFSENYSVSRPAVTALPDGTSAISAYCRGDVSILNVNPAEGILLDSVNNDRGLFVAKYSADGNALWAKRIYGGQAETMDSLSVAMSSDGSVFISGIFADEIVFEKGTENETTLASAGGEDIYLAKYDSDGNFLWATRAGGEKDALYSDWALDLAVTEDGFAYLTGAFNTEATFGAGEANETTLTAKSLTDAETYVAPYIAKYAPDGTLVFAIAPIGEGAAVAKTLGLAAGSVYIAGIFGGDLAFGEGCDSLVFDGTLDGADYMSAFVAKYTE